MLSFGIEGIGIKGIFTELIFPLMFLNTGYHFFKQLDYIWEDSRVQMVELVLVPKTILKV